MEMFRVLRPGSSTTVQDRGRFGYQHLGVPPAGALDDFSFQAANLLAGNGENEAALEITFQGPTLEVLGEGYAALTGAEMDVALNGLALPCWRSFRIKPGDRLKIGRARRGLRAYLAVKGGIDVPLVMGSRSTYTAASLGGFRGRPLAAGDVLFRGEGRSPAKTAACPVDLIPPLPGEITLRAIPGPQDDLFEEGLDILFSSAYEVTPEANRMGYRLLGEKVPLAHQAPRSIISEPSLPGGVQIPPGGNPIILLLEQTVGGYAKIATVISSDISQVAQAKPGDSIRFERITLQEAHRIYRDRKRLLDRLREAVLSA